MDLPTDSSRTGRELVVDRLCQILRQGIDVHRCLAAKALGRMGEPAAVDALTQALLDEDEDVRADAAEALGRLADRRACKPLLENLIGDPSFDVKSNAVTALVDLKDPEVTPWLRRILKGRDEAIVWDEDEFHQSGWDDWCDLQVQAINGLADLGVEDAVPEIMAVMDDEFGQDLSHAIVKALGRIGPAGLAPLVDLLKKPDVKFRRRAIATLVELQGPVSLKAARICLRDPSPDVRLIALRGVAAMSPDDELLKALLDDPATEVRVEAIRLAGVGHPDHLEQALLDEETEVRQAALEVLAAVPDALPGENTVEILHARLLDDDPEISVVAAKALGAVAGADAAEQLIVQLTDRSRPVEVREAALVTLAASGADGVIPILLDVLGDPRREMRLRALVILLERARRDATWPNEAGRALLSALRGELLADDGHEPDEETDAAAEDTQAGPGKDDETSETAGSAFPISTLAALANLPPTPSVEGGAAEEATLTEVDQEFLELTKRSPKRRRVTLATTVAPYHDIRRLAARLLGDLACDDVALGLAEALSDPDQELRLMAADSLARIAGKHTALPPEAIAALVELGRADNRDLRLRAARALGQVDDLDTVSDAAAFWNDSDPFVRAEATRALARLPGQRENLIGLLNDPEACVRLATAHVVAQQSDTDVEEILVKFALSWQGYHCREVGRLLRDRDNDKAGRLFLDALGSPDNIENWQFAIEALEELNNVVSGGGETAIS